MTPEAAETMLKEAGFNFDKEYLMIVPKGNQVRGAVLRS